MRKIILASHGNLAEGMLHAATVIAGVQENLSAYGMEKYESPEGIYDALYSTIQNNAEDEYVIICDIRGGSVHNKLVEYCVYENVCVVTGMNLGLVLELIFADSELTMKEAVLEAMKSSKDSMEYIDKEIIKHKDAKEDELW